MGASEEILTKPNPLGLLPTFPIIPPPFFLSSLPPHFPTSLPHPAGRRLRAGPQDVPSFSTVDYGMETALPAGTVM